MWLVQLQCPRTHLARSSRHPHPTRGVEHGRKSRRRGRGARARDGRDSSESDWRVRFAALEGEIAASSRGDWAADVPPFRSCVSTLVSNVAPLPRGCTGSESCNPTRIALAPSPTAIHDAERMSSHTPTPPYGYAWDHPVLLLASPSIGTVLLLYNSAMADPKVTSRPLSSILTLKLFFRCVFM